MDNELRILITGGSGFIGTNLVDHYLVLGAKVLSLDVMTPKKPDHLKVWKQVDILDAASLHSEVASFNPTHVYHLAARTDLDETKNVEGYSANTNGVKNIINALAQCRELKRVVFTSSMYVCEPGHDPKHYDDYSPHTVYGQSKVLSEKIVKETNPTGYDWVIIRPTSIWGPWFGYPYNEFFKHVRNGTYFNIKGKTATKTYGFILNSIQQMHTIMFAESRLVNHKTFYIGDAPGLNINDWALEIAKQMPTRLIPMPLAVIRLGSWFGDFINAFGFKFPLQSFRMKNMTTDNTISLIADTLQVAPGKPYSLEAGVGLTLDWMNNHVPGFKKAGTKKSI